MAKRKIINLLSSTVIILILISNLFSQHFNVEIDDTGESTLFIFQDVIQGLNNGDEIGLFDENYVSYGGEDHDFAWRFMKMGYQGVLYKLNVDGVQLVIKKANKQSFILGRLNQNSLHHEYKIYKQLRCAYE